MNVTDLSCAVSFENGLDGPIEKIGTLQKAFRCVKWGFGLKSLIEQNVGGARQQGGTIVRTHCFVIVTVENESALLSAALGNTMLKDCKIETYHNDEGGKKVVHIAVTLTEANIAMFEVFHTQTKDLIYCPLFVQDVVETSRAAQKIKELRAKAQEMGNAGYQGTEYTGRYALLLLRYNAVQLKVTKIEADGSASGSHAVKYEPYTFA